MKKSFWSILAVSLVLASPEILPAQTVLCPEFSTYLGGGDEDRANAIALDTANYIYLTGYTDSYDFPTTSVYQSSLSDTYETDAFVTRLSSSGTSLIFSTYFGGRSGVDKGHGIAVSASTGFIIVVGETDSVYFPVKSPYQSSQSLNEDAFLAQFQSNGGLWMSTYLGGSSYDRAYGVAVDAGDHAYVVGSTNSIDFPIVSAYKSSNPANYDAFLTKFSISGSALEYSTYLGGVMDDNGWGVAVDTENNAYVAGHAGSSDFPTLNCYQPSLSLSDAFVAKFQSSGSALSYSTYLGGSDGDVAKAIAVDSYNFAYVTGYTYSNDFPTFAPAGDQPFQAGHAGGSKDAFVTQVHASGEDLYYSTYLGGSGDEVGYGIAVDSAALAYAVGETSSSDFPVEGAYQSSFGGNKDAFLSRLSFHGDSLLHSTYLGGSGSDQANGVALDTNDNICLAGFSNSDNFPTVNPYQSSRQSTDYDSSAFLTKFSYQTAPPSSGRDYHTDFNGDGVSDIAIYRAGLWAVRKITRVYFGSGADTPVPGDYNGDGTTECAIFRPTSGMWAVRGLTRVYFGSSSDFAVPGDYNGDGTWEIGIFRPAAGLWSIRGVTRSYFGSGSDVGVPGDYNGDGSMDIALFRGSSGLWAMKGIGRVYFGGASDTPVEGDYNGDGTWEAAIFRSGLWAVRGVTRAYFGGAWDHSVPGDYNGAGGDDIGIFKSTSGLWAVKGVTRIYFGGTGDVPVTR